MIERTKDPIQKLISSSFIQSIILLVFAVLSYSNTFTSTFQFDDSFFIVNNLTIRNLGNLPLIWQGVLSQPSRFVGFLSFAVNYHFHGLNVVGYHVVNLAIHVCAGFCLWWFVRLLLLTPKLKTELISKHGSLVGFLTALLFISHPGQTQAITYISQRFSSLATLFYLCSICFYLKGRLRGDQNKSDVASFVCSGLFAILAMFTKEIAITLPVVILFSELFLFERKSQFLTDLNDENGKQIAFVLVLISFALIIPKLFDFNVKSLFFHERLSQSHDGDLITGGAYFLTQFRVFVSFVRLLLLPMQQNLDYDFVLSKSVFEVSTFMSLFVFLGMIALCVYFKKRNRLAAYGLGVFIICFLANFVPRRNVLFEHKLYLLSCGFLIFLCALLFQVLKSKRKATITICVIASVFACLTFARNSVWRNEVALWSDVAKKSPNKIRPLINLGKAYLKQDYFEPAIMHLNKALTMDPYSFKAYNNRGIYFRKRKEYDKALRDFNIALKIYPKFVKAYGNRGTLYGDMGKNELALKDFNKALSLDPSNAEVYNNLGLMYKKIQNEGLMVENYNKSIEMNPSNLVAYNNRANFHSKQKRYDLALADYNMAISINPNNAVSYNGRGATYFYMKEYDFAIRDYNKAISLKKKYYQAYSNRAMVLTEQKKYDLALKDFNMALKIVPHYLQGLYSRGKLFVKMKEYDAALKDYSKILELEPETINALHNRAAVYWEMKKFDYALTDIEKVIEINDSLASAHYIQSMIFKSMGKNNEAFESAQRARELGMNFESIKAVTIED